MFCPVSEIQCTFSGSEGRQGKMLGRDSITAKLRKPEGFKGAPLFADDRAVDPLLDAECQIRPEPDDLTGLAFTLLVTNFQRCGVLKRNVSEVPGLLIPYSTRLHRLYAKKSI